MTYGRAGMLPLFYLQKLSATLPDRVPENTESLVKSAMSPLAEVGLDSIGVTDAPLTRRNLCVAVLMNKSKTN